MKFLIRFCVPKPSPMASAAAGEGEDRQRNLDEDEAEDDHGGHQRDADPAADEVRLVPVDAKPAHSEPLHAARGEAGQAVADNEEQARPLKFADRDAPAAFNGLTIHRDGVLGDEPAQSSRAWRQSRWFP
jgi:hypothetical protein